MSSSVLVTKRELGRALGVTQVTLDRWLERFGDDVPCIERGTNGKPYQYDLAAVTEFFRVKREAEAASKAERDEALAQLTLPIALPKDEDPKHVSLKDRAEALKIRKLEREEAERLGRLVPVDQLAAPLAEAFADLSRRLHGKIGALGRTHNLPPEVVKALSDGVAAAQREFIEAVRQRAPGLADAA